MHFKKKFIQKIFSINVKPKFICSKEKKSPEDRYGKCVDKILMDFKKSPQNLSNFKKCEDEMLSIHYDFLDQSNELLDEKYGITPVERMKKFQEKMKNKIINEEGEEEMQEENLSNNNKKFLDNRDSESEDLFILEKKKNMIKTTNKKAEDPISKKNEIFDKVTSSNEKGTKKINSKADEKYFESSSRGLNFIPQNLIIKTLKFPKNGSEVLLLGVENRNSNHASFMIGLK